MATPAYKLERSPQSLLFRKLVLTFQSDPTLKRVVKTWRVWAPNTPDNLREPALGELPLVRLTPSSGPDQHWGPSAFSGTLAVVVECFLPGADADDAFDLYWALRLALYPRDDARRTAIHQSLVELGARAHFTLRFSQPSFRPTPDPNNPFVRAIGLLQLDLVEDLNP